MAIPMTVIYANDLEAVLEDSGFTITGPKKTEPTAIFSYRPQDKPADAYLPAFKHDKNERLDELKSKIIFEYDNLNDIKFDKNYDSLEHERTQPPLRINVYDFIQKQANAGIVILGETPVTIIGVYTPANTIRGFTPTEGSFDVTQVVSGSETVNPPFLYSQSKEKAAILEQAQQAANKTVSDLYVKQVHNAWMELKFPTHQSRLTRRPLQEGIDTLARYLGNPVSQK